MGNTQTSSAPGRAEQGYCPRAFSLLSLKVTDWARKQDTPSSRFWRPAVHNEATSRVRVR